MLYPVDEVGEEQQSWASSISELCWDSDLYEDSFVFGTTGTHNLSLPDDSSFSAPVSMSTEIPLGSQAGIQDCGEAMELLGLASGGKSHSADDCQKAAQTRKLTACVRCRMQRIRVQNSPTIK
jgi:hypothetical protein